VHKADLFHCAAYAIERATIRMNIDMLIGGAVGILSVVIGYYLSRIKDVVIFSRISVDEVVGLGFEHEILDSAIGERCNNCGAPATHKVAEVLNNESRRHEFNRYVCCDCFVEIFPQAKKFCIGQGGY